MKRFFFTIAAIALTLTINNVAGAQCHSSGGYRPIRSSSYPLPYRNPVAYPQHHYVPKAPCNKTYQPTPIGGSIYQTLPVKHPVQQVPVQPVQQVPTHPVQQVPTQPVQQVPTQPVSVQQPQPQVPVQPQVQPQNAQPAGKETFSSRFLKLKNESKIDIQVSLLYRDYHPQKGWYWAPASPNQPTKALQFTMKPGQVVDLTDANGKRVDTSRIRIWASTKLGNWTEFQQKDLWLVEANGQSQSRQYLADEMGTFEFVFPGADASQPTQTAQQQLPQTKPADSAQ